MAKKYVETYSSSNAAAQDPEERVRLTNIKKIHYKINSRIQKLQKKKKIEQTRRLADLECPKSPAQSLHIPSTSHNNPRTSQSCRQNNNFRLIYSNVRNYFPWCQNHQDNNDISPNMHLTSIIEQKFLFDI